MFSLAWPSPVAITAGRTSLRPRVSTHLGASCADSSSFRSQPSWACSSSRAATPRARSGGSGGGGAEAGPGTVCATTDAADDLLAEICDKGVLTVSTDPAYPPQSKYLPKEDKFVGFDIDVATEIANRLGVDVAWETPSWDVITAGSWNGRWDASVGSMTPTNDRQQVLDFTEPYYFTPAPWSWCTRTTPTIKDLSTDLDGKTIGVCSGCTYEQFLNKALNIKGFEFDFVIDDADGQGLRHRHHRVAGPRAR